eukprot:13247496-Heterocapsa_arctica.AAC.1
MAPRDEPVAELPTRWDALRGASDDLLLHARRSLPVQDLPVLARALSRVERVDQLPPLALTSHQGQARRRRPHRGELLQHVPALLPQARPDPHSRVHIALLDEERLLVGQVEEGGEITRSVEALQLARELESLGIQRLVDTGAQPPKAAHRHLSIWVKLMLALSCEPLELLNLFGELRSFTAAMRAHLGSAAAPRLHDIPSRRYMPSCQGLGCLRRAARSITARRWPAKKLSPVTA